MEKSSHRIAMIVGLTTAVATVCAAIITGVFTILGQRMNPPGPSTVAQTLSTPVNTLPPPTVGPVDTPIAGAPWKPGAPHATYPHVIAADTEGEWSPEPGYDWVNPDDESDWTVVWNPGEPDPDNPNVVASDTEGNWKPAPGYTWCHPEDENDLSVCPVLGTIEVVDVEHDVTEGDRKGMRIHVKLTVNELHDIRCNIGAYFYDAPSGNPLAASASETTYNANGTVYVGTDFIPSSRMFTDEDYAMFLPYEALNVSTDVPSAELKFIVRLYNWRDETFIAESSEYLFKLTNN